MKIAGAWSGHDCSYCILGDGRPIIHDEYERFVREKEPRGDSIRFLFENYPDHDDIQYLAVCTPFRVMSAYKESLQRLGDIVEKNGGEIVHVGHHEAHAANAFFSSNFDDAIILTLDGGGVERDGHETSCTVWSGKGNQITPMYRSPLSSFNIGGLWTRATRYIFKLQSGWPRGHQAGTVMAMSAFGDPSVYYNDFLKMLTQDIQFASFKPSSQPKGAYVSGKDPIHPYLQKWALLAEESEQQRFDLAAGLQCATETVFKDLLENILGNGSHTNLCLAGGVTLNSVMVGKIHEWYPQITGIYVTPTPHDGGLPIGAAQYLWHQVLGNPRIGWRDNFTPYLGKTYTEAEIITELEGRVGQVSYRKASDDEMIEALADHHLVSVFGGGSESGRRALGNRSILADPTSHAMKGIINDKVKHRQWFRPFAPSVLEEHAGDWFENYMPSPYMNLVLKFKKEKQPLVPAVLHCDGSARLQTVSANDNPWYHSFLSKWEKNTGVPILLNTSFNDREPICETPKHAIDCFLGTEIDYLYFRDYHLLVEKK